MIYFHTFDVSTHSVCVDKLYRLKINTPPTKKSIKKHTVPTNVSTIGGMNIKKE